MRLATRMALALLACAPIAAASSGGGHGEKKEERVEGAGFVGPRVPTIAMPTLVAPVVVDGVLDRYVFLSVTLELTSDLHKTDVADKIPYIQDAYLRYVHGANIVKNNDPAQLDEEGLKLHLLEVGTKIVGPDILKAVQLRNIVDAVH